LNDPVQASYLISVDQNKAFDALLDVRSFPEWGLGLREARALDESGTVEESEIRPGTRFEFTLSAAGFTHRIISAVTVVEVPRKIEWRYVKGAVGSGGWRLEESGANAVRMTLFTDYQVNPGWLNRIAHRQFFRGITEDLLRRSMRRFEEHLRGP
jgi:ribosome-associated toxin RatA of RatAB toxin-antitoxin module